MDDIDAVAERNSPDSRATPPLEPVHVPDPPAVDREGFIAAVKHKVSHEDFGPLVAVAFADINGFSDVNLRFGYRSGDGALGVLNALLNDCLRDIDEVWRIGDDEFGLILPRMQSMDHARLAATKIAESLKVPLLVGDQVIDLRISIGITNVETGNTDIETCFRHATIAVRRAKRKHQGYAIYDNSDSDIEELPPGYLARLRRAVSENRLELVFQSKVDVASDKVVGAEALLRWHDEEIGTRSPEEFIRVAEQSDLIDSITRWTINAGISQCARWHRSGHAIGIAVNLSARSISNADIFTVTRRALDTWNLNPGWLTLEITETAMMEDQTLIIPTLERLSSLGIKLSIDDFGTGYSSLAYLRSLPVDELKIDKSFVLEIDSNSEDCTIVKTIIELGKNFGLKVTAEGVENEASYNLLKELHCDLAQGYFITRPIPAADFGQYLTAANTSAA